MAAYSKYGSLSESFAREIKRWMIMVAEDYIDPFTGEVNCTELAEAASDEFDVYVNDRQATIPEHIFELSFEVAETYIFAPSSM